MEKIASYADNDIVSWAESFFYVPEPAGPIVLQPHQKAMLRAIESRGPSGAHRFRTAVYSTPKKSGKTTIAALVARFRAESGGAQQEIYCVANDFEQAQGRVFQAARTSIEMMPGWERYWKTGEKELRHLPSGSVIRAIANDYKGEAGANPSLTVWTELWGYQSERSRRLWEELTPVPTRDSTRLIETYAGFDGESELLWELYERGVLQGRQLSAWELHELTQIGLGCFEEASDPDILVPVWVDEASALLVYWDTGEGARRMPWQQGDAGRDYYAEQEGSLRPAAFQRLHCNVWVAAEDSFVPIEWWDACQCPHALLPGDKTYVVIGIDAGVSSDSFGLVGVTRHPGCPDQIIVRFVQKWDPPPGGTIDYAGPEAMLRDLCKRYNVVQVAYDPFQLHDFATRLGNERVAWFRKFSQQAERLVADKTLYDLIRDGRICHDGDPDLRSHIQNSNARLEKDQDSKLRIVKKSQNRKIDLAVALSMACSECLRLRL
jgi:phage terminase large subunit-like protein